MYDFSEVTMTRIGIAMPRPSFLLKKNKPYHNFRIIFPLFNDALSVIKYESKDYYLENLLNWQKRCQYMLEWLKLINTFYIFHYFYAE